ncbi:FAD-binding oxidoreductase [Bosea sp. R86505]|uniref:FAD-binding oxidoreductase n=1 Tax=Bosea sp. R86505 TaxID=3101710 RepID=UPI00366E878A
MSFPATALQEAPAFAPVATLPPSADAITAVTQALAASFGNRLVTSLAVRQQHGHTLTWIPNQPPDAVVYPHDTQEVSEIVTLCARHGVPVIAFGTGTSLEGHVNAPYGGVCVDLSQMKRIIAVHAEDLDCLVEAGVTRKELNEHLRDMGLMFPIDPGADASIGGMAATRASGTNAVRYGTMKDNVLALTAVMADGSIVKTSTRARKTSAGYDLTRLLVGSEGTLGIITEITLKLHGIPEAIAAGVCPFPSIKAACDTAIMTIQTGIPVARIELLDEVMIKGFNLHSKLGLPETPMLFVEFHGTEAWVKEQSERFGEISAENGGGAFDWATKAEDRTRLWEARHNGYWAGRALRPGADTLATDVCVPISQLAECVEETKRDIEATGLIAPIAGHVGDGNFHTQPLLDLADPDEVARVQGFLDRLVKRALAMGGTCTGEHGVGQKKIKYLEAEHGAPALAVMRTLKRALDPQNILNPGKIVLL